MGARAKALREEYDAIPPSVAEAAASLIGEQEREIASLKRQRDGLVARNAVLQEELNGLQLKLSLEETKRKLHEHNVLLRVVALEQHMDRIANYVQGLPSREEFAVVQNDLYALSGRVPL